jgi:hypothetical protein
MSSFLYNSTAKCRFFQLTAQQTCRLLSAASMSFFFSSAQSQHVGFFLFEGRGGSLIETFKTYFAAACRVQGSPTKPAAR